MPNNEYFQGNPVRLDVSRSKMRPRAPRWFGAWDVGKLVPIFATSSVMPGDTFKMSVSSVVRMIRPVFPVMDDMEITIEAYFVPHRLILSRKSMSPDVNDSNHSWQAFIGAQDSVLNMPTPGSVTLPSFIVSNGSTAGTPDYVVGGVGDCLGYPNPNAPGQYYVNVLKGLAYCSIWNEYFREPNVQNPVTYSIAGGGCLIAGTDAGVSAMDAGYISRWKLFPVSRYHGYFGSALPWPQRNTDAVKMPLGTDAPVVAKGSEHTTNGDYPIMWRATDSAIPDGTLAASAVGSPATSSVGGVFGSPSQLDHQVYPSNLYTDLSEATAATVNQFRLAVQTQRWYEQLARCGNKYSDLVHGMFGVRGVSIPDRPEYLGGFTAPINITQVAQTGADSSSTGGTTAGLGKVGAYSVTNPGGFLFSKSFTEHGTIMVVMCCRVNDSFCQGLDREDSRFDRFDFYWPQFANLGEQPVLEKEIYITGADANDKSVFGYQEAWAEYRMFNDKVTGKVRPTVSQGLGFMTYCNNFSSAPTLKGFLDASKQAYLVDNTLEAAHTTVGYQLYGSFAFQIEMTRPMPLYSIPGLVDHH